MTNVTVIDAHPNKDSFCAALARHYAEGVALKGHNVEHICLRDIQFDLMGQLGNEGEETWEPDLEAIWEKIESSKHVCFVYPTWWGGHPALLQSFFERILVSGKAYRYRADGWWDKLLSGRSAQVVTTMNAPGFYYRILNRNCGVVRMKKTILEFCGLKTKVKALYSVRASTVEKRQKWLQDVKIMGHNAVA